MPNYITWQILHVLCIIAHIGLIIDAAAVLAVGEYWSIQDDSSSNSLISYGVCSWAATGIGALGVAANGIFFHRMYRLETRNRDETNQSRYVKQKFVYTVAIATNVLITAADFAIAGDIGGNLRGGKLILASTVALAAIAGFMALGTIFVDISQLRRLRAEAHPNSRGNIVAMEPSGDQTV